MSTFTAARQFVMVVVLRLVRDRTALFFMTVLPVVVIVIIGVTFGSDGGVEIGVVDGSPGSVAGDRREDAERPAAAREQARTRRLEERDALREVQRGEADGTVGIGVEVGRSREVRRAKDDGVEPAESLGRGVESGTEARGLREVAAHVRDRARTEDGEIRRRARERLRIASEKRHRVATVRTEACEAPSHAAGRAEERDLHAGSPSRRTESAERSRRSGSQARRTASNAASRGSMATKSSRRVSASLAR